jgi:hypothetical protein
MCLELGDGHSIHTGRSFVLLHVPEACVQPFGLAQLLEESSFDGK